MRVMITASKYSNNSHWTRMLTPIHNAIWHSEVQGKNLLSCLGRVTLGVKDTPFLGSAWGAKEAVDLLTRREFVDGQRAKTRKQTHSDLPRFRPPEG